MINDPHWCERLYHAGAAKLLLYGRALGLSHAEAEDVLQGTFEALLALPEPPRSPECYCIRTYRNRALNIRRGWWRRLWREFESKRWFEQSTGESEQEIIAMEGLVRLPMLQREVIVLKIWHQYTFETIGRMLSISPHTVAGRYRYGLQKLRTYIQNNEYEESRWMGTTDEWLETAPPSASH